MDIEREAIDDFEESVLEEDEHDVAGLIHRLEIVAKRQVQDLFAGEYRSAFKGRGMAFVDHKIYEPGDEIRWIDWKVSARMGATYVKQFAEERERTVMLLWDASASMDMGTQRRTKRELSAEIGMLLALSAVQNGDRVGLIIFGDHVDKFIPPKKGRNHVMRLIKDMLRYRTPEVSDGSQRGLTLALQFLQHVAPRHTISFLISDFLFAQDEINLRLTARKHDLVSIVIRDPIESSLPSPSEGLDDEGGHTFSGVEQTADGRLSALFFSALLGFLLLLPGILWGGSWWVGGLVSAGLCLGFGVYSVYAPLGGVWLVRDLETHEILTLDVSSSRIREEYRQHQAQRREELERLFLQLQIDGIFLGTEEDVLPTLLGFFSLRRKRLTR